VTVAAVTLYDITKRYL